jgi:hypothetical protein
MRIFVGAAIATIPLLIATARADEHESSGSMTATPGETTRVSVSSHGTEGNHGGARAAISADGQTVAFSSGSSNLVPDDSNEADDTFVHDRRTGATTRVSVATGGAQANHGSSGTPAISADGRYVAFASTSSNLVVPDSNDDFDVFVHDRATGATTQLSVAFDGTQANDGSTSPAISGDGRYVAFLSSASNLVSGDTNGQIDAFVHDRANGVTARVSVDSAGLQGNSESFFRPSISFDGRYVTFISSASNLVPGDTNGQRDVFVHDRSNGVTTRVSLASDGSQANGGATSVSISGGGRYVTFASDASNLVADDKNGRDDVYVHDRETLFTTRVSVATGGTEGNGTSRNASISGEGRYVAFESYASNLVPDDTNLDADAFLHDRQTGDTRLLSVDTNGTQGNSSSQSPAISADGRHVAFASLASNLVSGDSNGSNDVFVRDEAPAVVHVDIDVKPHVVQNGINLRSKGNLRVAILGSAVFDALQVDPVSVRLGPGEAIPRRYSVTDYNRDSYQDLGVLFRIQDVGLGCRDTAVTLTAETYAGTSISGTDAVRPWSSCSKKDGRD